MLITALSADRDDGSSRSAVGDVEDESRKVKYSHGPAPKDLTVVVESDENNYRIGRQRNRW